MLTQLKFIRLGKEIKLIALAEVAKISPSLLSKIENGKCIGSKNTRIKIAEALGVSEHVLFGAK